MSPFISNDLPTNIERAVLIPTLVETLAYLVFQLPGFTKIPITREDRKLLPHVFTFSPTAEALAQMITFSVTVPLAKAPAGKVVYFLWHFPSFRSSFPNAFPLGSEMPYVARTFLHVA